MKEIKQFTLSDKIPQNASYLSSFRVNDGFIFFYEVPIVEKEKKSSDNHKQEIQEVLGHLNLKAGKSFTMRSKANSDAIRNLLNQKFTVAEMKTVIDKKCDEWLNSPEWSKYLRPTTLFRASKFESYLNQKSGEEIAQEGFSELDAFLNKKKN